jgi:hypothetical protein
MPYTKKYKSTLYNKDWLYNLHVVENKNCPQIAKIIGCDRTAVHTALKRFGIPIKDRSEAQKVSKYNHGSNTPRPRGKFKDTLSNPEWLRQRFVIEKKTMATMAREAGSSVPSVQRSLRKILGLEETKHPSDLAEEQLAEFRARRRARLIHPKQPCLICENPKSTLNHIDGNPLNNNDENIEHLCISHHLMVDKRLAGRVVRWFRKHHMDLWLDWHKEVLEELKINPNPLPRWKLKTKTEE